MRTGFQKVGRKVCPRNAIKVREITLILAEFPGSSA